MTDFADRKILIVDDSRFSLTITKTFLAKFGYKNILTAESGENALSILNEACGGSSDCDIDIVMLDVVMDDIDGIEVCRRIKDDDRLKDVPVLMVTGKEKGELMETVFSAGAFDFVSKPIDKVDLMARVRSSLMLKHEVDIRRELEKELQSLREHKAG